MAPVQEHSPTDTRRAEPNRTRGLSRRCLRSLSSVMACRYEFGGRPERRRRNAIWVRLTLTHACQGLYLEQCVQIACRSGQPFCAFFCPYACFACHFCLLLFFFFLLILILAQTSATGCQFYCQTTHIIICVFFFFFFFVSSPTLEHTQPAIRIFKLRQVSDSEVDSRASSDLGDATAISFAVGVVVCVGDDWPD